MLSLEVAIEVEEQPKGYEVASLLRVASHGASSHLQLQEVLQESALLM